MSLSENIFNELRELSLKINPNPIPFSIHINIGDHTLKDLRSREGIDIDITDVQIDPKTGTWVYKDKHVLLFIADQGWYFDDVMNGLREGKKYHLTDCKTIDDMKQKDKFARYHVTNNTEGIFAIHGISKSDRQKKTGEVRLHVCKNCLTKLNYKKYANATFETKKDIYDNFNLDEFFEHYKTHFIAEPPNVGQDKAGYSDDWAEISRRYRSYKNWTCEMCHVNLSEHRELLDTHHIDGVKQNNATYNLKALCKTCHQKQPHHGHYRVAFDVQSKLDELRKTQGLI